MASLRATPALARFCSNWTLHKGFGQEPRGVAALSVKGAAKQHAAMWRGFRCRCTVAGEWKLALRAITYIRRPAAIWCGPRFAVVLRTTLVPWTSLVLRTSQAPSRSHRDNINLRTSQAHISDIHCGPSSKTGPPFVLLIT